MKTKYRFIICLAAWASLLLLPSCTTSKQITREYDRKDAIRKDDPGYVFIGFFGANIKRPKKSGKTTIDPSAKRESF